MNLRSILTGLLIVYASNALGQTSITYSEKITVAEQHHQDKKFLEAAQLYSHAFSTNNNKGQLRHRYNAARCWAMAGEIDSAFFQLERVANNGFGKYAEYNQIKNDPELEILHFDKRWIEVLELIKANKDKAESKYNKPLVAILDSIYNDDQTYRKRHLAVGQKFGPLSKELRDLSRTIAYKDSVNLIKVRAILDKYGWLGVADVGQQGNATLFLVIQHSSQGIQERYLPMMREAVKNKKASPSSLALLEDRVALGQKKKQIYGSQLGQNKTTGSYYVLPLEDPENVDQRRMNVNLPPLKDYVISWGINWSIERYKKDLKDNEKE